MAETYFPFNSVSGDRTYGADSFAEFFGDIIASGVSANGDNLPVTAADGLVISVGAGLGWINGHLYKNDTTKSLTLSVGGSSPRIDRIVVRLMVTERMMEAMVVEGTGATDPTAPDLLRNDDYWDICLAEIYVAASAIAVTDENITDTRGDDDLCGVVRALVDAISVGDFLKNCQAEFDAWMSDLQDVLSDDVAGNLQVEIDNMAVKITFDETDWTDNVLTITQLVHKKSSDAFSYRIFHLVSDALKSTTWAAMTTQAAYDADTGDIILTTETPFGGQIILIG